MVEQRRASGQHDNQLIAEQHLYSANGTGGIVSQPSAVVMSRESDDYRQGITNSAASGTSDVSKAGLASRKDCCLQFFKNGFKRHPSCMPSAVESQSAT